MFEFESLAEVFCLELGEVVLPPLQLDLQLAHLLLLLSLLLHDLPKFRLLLRDFIPQFVAQLKLYIFFDSSNYQIFIKVKFYQKTRNYFLQKWINCRFEKLSLTARKNEIEISVSRFFKIISLAQF